MKKINYILFLLANTVVFAQSKSVGIGVLSPDPTAILHVGNTLNNVGLVPATITASVTDGKVTGLTIVDGGKGYVAPVTLSISGGTTLNGSERAIAEVTDLGGHGEITGVSLVSGGSGYIGVPLVAVGEGNRAVVMPRVTLDDSPNVPVIPSISEGVTVFNTNSKPEANSLSLWDGSAWLYAQLFQNIPKSTLLLYNSDYKLSGSGKSVDGSSYSLWDASTVPVVVTPEAIDVSFCFASLAYSGGATALPSPFDVYNYKTQTGIIAPNSEAVYQVSVGLNIDETEAPIGYLAESAYYNSPYYLDFFLALYNPATNIYESLEEVSGTNKMVRQEQIYLNKQGGTLRIEGAFAYAIPVRNDSKRYVMCLGIGRSQASPMYGTGQERIIKAGSYIKVFKIK